MRQLLTAALISACTLAQAQTAPTVIANDDRATVKQGAVVSTNVTHNDQGFEKRQARLRLLTVPAHGVAVVQSEKRIAYTPDVTFWGNDEYVYEVEDPVSGERDSAVVRIGIISDPSLQPDQTEIITDSEGVQTQYMFRWQPNRPLEPKTLDDDVEDWHATSWEIRARYDRDGATLDSAVVVDADKPYADDQSALVEVTARPGEMLVWDIRGINDAGEGAWSESVPNPHPDLSIVLPPPPSVLRITIDRQIEIAAPPESREWVSEGEGGEGD